MAKRFYVLTMVLVFGIIGLWAQVNGDYRSRATGNWNTAATWSIYSNGSWSNASTAPIVSTNATITIQNGHAVTHNASGYNATGYNRVVVQNGGILTINHNSVFDYNTLTINDGGSYIQLQGRTRVSGPTIIAGLFKNAVINDQIFTGGGTVLSTGVYEHAANGGTISELTWEDDSKLLISGITHTVPNAIGNYHHVIWNCPNHGSSYPLEGNLNNISGNLQIINTGTGSGSIYVSNSSQSKTITLSGNLIIEGGEFGVKGATNVPPSHKLVVNGDYVQNGGRLRINRINAPSVESQGDATLELKGNFFMSEGEITNTHAENVSQIIFSKTGTQTFTKTGGMISNKINFTVNPGSTLDLGTSVIDGSTGTFTLSSGAGLITAHENGIAATDSIGSIQVGGTRSYNTGADYTYNGSVAQITGSGLPGTVRNLTIDNPTEVTLTNSVNVSGNLTIRSGTIVLNKKTLTVNGSVIVEGGNLPASPEISIFAYESSANYVSIVPESGTISNLAVSTNPNGATEASMVNRTWYITGNVPENTNLTFSWTADDDGNFDWTNVVPVVYQGSKVLDLVSFGDRTVTVRVNSLDARAEFKIVKSGGDTLPVELSSFSANLSASGFVSINWVAQSETNLLGYHLYRALGNDIHEAIVISPLISALNSSNIVSYQYEDDQLFENGTYYYWLQSTDFDGQLTLHDPLVIFYERPGSNTSPSVPQVTGITAVYPNPFNPVGNIQFGLEKAAEATIEVYNQRGQSVRVLGRTSYSAGTHRLQWNGRDDAGKDCGTGIYLIRMDVEGRSYFRKVALVK